MKRSVPSHRAAPAGEGERRPSGDGASSRAVVLLSGGLDSTTALCWARAKGWGVAALAVSYGQRHVRELASARAVARRLGVPLHIVSLELPWLKVSSLVGRSRELPNVPLSSIGKGPIPSTYVPGRNAVFLSLAASLADAIGAGAIVIGANSMDFSGYPDCRPEFIRSFERTARLGTRLGAEGGKMRVLSPLQRLDKAGIVKLALGLKAPLGLTWSCYAGKAKPCGLCDSCKLRARGFAEAGVEDPYVQT
ncbi:MAG: 7-cyano-7-deazaguanine synthase QueC [Elusimicrobia bacterium]|nr:7-cyano-7-deazaguanine synthase QueC [Elusimicrobiota bacterium]